MQGLISLLAVLAAAAIAQAGSVTVEFWNDMADDVVVSAPGGAPATIARYKGGSFPMPEDARSLTIRAKGCDYVLTFPGPLKDFRDGGQESVRLYLSDATKIYIVPPDLIVQTPPDFLEPRQPNQFPIEPGKPECKTS